MLSSVAAFRPIKKRRTVNLDLLGLVVQQMQGLMDSPVDPDNHTEVAMQDLVSRWHGMLLSALVEEAKKA